MTSLKAAGLGLALGLAAGLTLAYVTTAKANEQAVHAQAQADQARKRVQSLLQRARTDSAALEAQRVAYDTLKAHSASTHDSLKRVTSTLRMVAFHEQVRTDSLLQGDTAAQNAVNEERRTAAQRIRVITADRDNYRRLFLAADSGWTAERAAHQRTREALDSVNAALELQVKATEQWRKVAHPSLAIRFFGDLKPGIAGAAAAVVAMALSGHVH